MSRTRNIMFTVFPSDFEELRLLDPSLWPHCKFAVWQLEMCPDTHRLHYQGYAEFAQPMSHIALHQCEGLETAHFEARQGTAQQAKKYCTKDDSRVDGPWFWPSEGAMSSQGARNDLEAVRELVKQGASERQIAEEHFGTFIRYNRGIKLYKQLVATPRSTMPIILLWIGPSGAGKTQEVLRRTGQEAYWKAPGKWWDGYDGQEAIVLDEFHGDWFPFRDLLRILDSTPLKVETKGGSAEFRGTTFYITSNQHPKDWYDPNKVGPWAESPLNRRLQQFGHYIMDLYVPPRRADYGAPQNDIPFEIANIDFDIPPDLFPLAEGLPPVLE